MSNKTDGTGGQAQLLDVRTREISPYWIDPNQPLKVPRNPLHYQAHKLQMLLERLEIQAERNPAQFNSSNYNEALKSFTKICEAINRGEDTIDAGIDDGGVAETSGRSKAPAVGEGASAGVDSRISPDNPFAG